MKYSIINLNDKNYNLMGIKLPNGKTCCYWSNKENDSFNKVIIIFDNKNVVDVKDNQVCISLNGINDEEDILNMIEAFGRELYKNKINITKIDCDFIVDNKDEELIVNDTINKFMLKGNVIKSDKYSYLTENLDDAINNISILSEDKQIVKNDNNTIKKYTIHEDKVYDDNDDISLDMKKQRLLSEWMNDSDMLLKISTLSKEELDRRLTAAVTNNLKVNYMDNPTSNSIDDDNFSRVSNDVAEYEDGKVNTELGIVSNNVSNTNEYSVVEKDDDELKVVNPIVSNTNINANNNSSVNTISANNSVDDYFWNNDGLGDLPINKDLSSERVSKQNNVSNGKVRVLKKPDRPVYPRDGISRGSIGLPTIIFIISSLLLVGSVIILYLMK